MKYIHNNWRNQYTLKLRKKLGKPVFRDWDIQCRELFGQNPEAEPSSDELCTPADMYCFTIWHYTHLLDNVKSLSDLIEGLFQLSPFADDALEVALAMSEADFIEFKLVLVQERKSARGEGESKMLEKYFSLVLPERFSMAIMLSGQAAVSLGPALIRIMETELGL
jgi:hypothetical protein